MLPAVRQVSKWARLVWLRCRAGGWALVGLRQGMWSQEASGQYWLQHILVLSRLQHSLAPLCIFVSVVAGPFSFVRSWLEFRLRQGLSEISWGLSESREGFGIQFVVIFRELGAEFSLLEKLGIGAGSVEPGWFCSWASKAGWAREGGCLEINGAERQVSLEENLEVVRPSEGRLLERSCGSSFGFLRGGLGALGLGYGCKEVVPINFCSTLAERQGLIGNILRPPLPLQN
ncbi:hypothetical protein Pyn_33245 [Prunus yedoensis var. nudiflora]|uniref:Uncharacterized protein n=1 Tax=Prunus yedoensis var. nudiflora TaxID=2094558 RepID=A0A314Y194_PRUYE|nr:hypothetical protein Pyn_33245 [Prunus yedoensis var. nudiflora]